MAYLVNTDNSERSLLPFAHPAVALAYEAAGEDTEHVRSKLAADVAEQIERANIRVSDCAIVLGGMLQPVFEEMRAARYLPVASVAPDAGSVAEVINRSILNSPRVNVEPRLFPERLERLEGDVWELVLQLFKRGWTMWDICVAFLRLEPKMIAAMEAEAWPGKKTEREQ